MLGSPTEGIGAVVGPRGAPEPARTEPLPHCLMPRGLKQECCRKCRQPRVSQWGVVQMLINNTVTGSVIVLMRAAVQVLSSWVYFQQAVLQGLAQFNGSIWKAVTSFFLLEKNYGNSCCTKSSLRLCRCFHVLPSLSNTRPMKYCQRCKSSVKYRNIIFHNKHDLFKD